MKQPSIKIFNGVYKVMGIEYDTSGTIDRVWFALNPDSTRLVVRGSEILNASGATRKIQVPTEHPHYNYIVAPNLERLLVRN